MNDDSSQKKSSFFSRMQAPLAQGGLLDNCGRASLMGLHLVSGMIVGTLLGYVIDRWVNIFPWCSIIGFFFGIVAGFKNMWTDAKYIMRHSESSKSNANKSTDSRS